MSVNLSNATDFGALAFNTASTVGQTMAAKTAALYSAAIAKTNAKLAREQGAFKVNRIVQEGREFVGAQRAAAAGSGVRVDTGSMQDVVTDTLTRVDLDAAVAKYNAELDAYGYDVTAAVKTAEASQYSPLMALGSSLLTNATYLQKKYAALGKYEKTKEG